MTEFKRGLSQVVEQMTKPHREQPSLKQSSFLSSLSSTSISSSFSSLSLVNSSLSHSLLPSYLRQIQTRSPIADDRHCDLASSQSQSSQSSQSISKTDSADFSKIVRIWSDIDLEEIEADTKTGLSFGKLMVAGSTAGVSEHLVMFPVDTVKTRMQAEIKPGMPVYRNPFHAVATIIRDEGFFRLYRGVSATVTSAIPSHGVYFATYEFWKRLFGGDKGGHRPLQNGAAGGLAIMAHDAVVTPLDVVKQRLQLKGSRYNGVLSCIRQIYAEEGLRAFFASYTTTVFMNVPFISVQFAAYESLKIFLTSESGEHGPFEQLVGGGLAGALGGFVSTPFDVLKTRLQTQEVERGHRRKRPRELAKQIWHEGGLRGIFRGAQARVLYFIPSAAICWTTYETMKKILLLSVRTPKDD